MRGKVIIMTTIKINNTNNNVKLTRVDAMNYAIEHLTDAPQDVMDKLQAIRDSFAKRPSGTTESKAAKENKALAAALVDFVNREFDENDPMKINARYIANSVRGITTTQKVAAVARYADIVKFKHQGRVFYAPAGTEIA